MSERSSHATQPSESDFHDSHPLDSSIKDKSTPSIGDLSSIDTSIDASNANTPTVGSIPDIDDAQKSEVLGDISLLDEAFAEMNESHTDIPVLNDSITTPSESKILSAEDQSSSIPLLDQEATIYAEMLKPSSKITEPEPKAKSSIESDDPVSDIEDTPLFNAPNAKSNSNISEMNSSLETAAELLNEAAPSDIQPETAQNSGPTTAVIETKTTAADSEIEEAPRDGPLKETENNDSALEALLDEEPETAESMSAHLSQISESVTSIDEKILGESKLTNDDSEIEIHEVPLSAMSGHTSETSDFSVSLAADLNSDSNETNTLDTQMLTDNLTEPDGTEISEFNPEIDLNSAAIPQTSHSIGITSQGIEPEQEQNNLNISIPFELHSQLSHKIDELVIQATSSITNELHTQLSSRLDVLLAGAVESVLPKLVNQMATELRNEVNDRIKQQLPIIIDEVLNHTRLHK